MILIYAYLKKLKNYLDQEIVFDRSWQVRFLAGKLSLRFCGKTNLLQLIGAKHDVRHHRK